MCVCVCVHARALLCFLFALLSCRMINNCVVGVRADRFGRGRVRVTFFIMLLQLVSSPSLQLDGSDLVCAGASWPGRTLKSCKHL